MLSSAVVQFPRKESPWQSVYCWHRQPCSVTSLGSTAKRPKLLIWLSSLRWSSSPNLVNVSLKICLMRWNREEYLVLCTEGLIYHFFSQKPPISDKGNRRKPSEEHVKTELIHLPSSVKRLLVRPDDSANMCGVNMGTLMASRRDNLYFWELTYLHCPAEALSVLALLPQNSYQGLSFHPLVNAVLANQLWWHLCCMFGPKCSCAIHRLNHKMLQHHSSYREEANWRGYAHTSTCRVDITKHINTFLITYSAYNNIASNWTCSI